jgi:tetratricopeptide (TPR) repeat protein
MPNLPRLTLLWCLHLFSPLLLVLPGCDGQPTATEETFDSQRYPVTVTSILPLKEVPLESPTGVEIQEFFNQFTAAFSTRKADRFVEIFDTQITLELLRAQGLLAPAVDPRQNAKLARALDQQVSHQVTDADNGYGWKELEIRRIMSQRDNAEMIVYVHQRNSNGMLSRMRWWLRRVAEQWRAYDFELLDDSIRFSSKLGAGFQMGTLDSPGAQTIPSMMSAIERGQLGDPGTSIPQLQSLANSGLPPIMELLRLTMLGHFLASEQQFAAALVVADQVDQIQVDLPVNLRTRAIAMAAMGQYDAAGQAVKRYAEIVEKDGHYHWLQGEILRLQGNVSEAKANFQQGIAADPAAGWNLYGLAQTSAALERDAVLPEILKLPNTSQWLGEMKRRAQLQQDEALLAWLSQSPETAPGPE